MAVKGLIVHSTEKDTPLRRVKKQNKQRRRRVETDAAPPVVQRKQENTIGRKPCRCGLRKRSSPQGRKISVFASKRVAFNVSKRDETGLLEMSVEECARAEDSSYSRGRGWGEELCNA
ncbi:hypothetical protein NDU88_002184 [Pleurodeles waltl]|uniref:Uncharacterized protein n=1 Tax=Pleurodeles waltl TaxID=8319 RepID=A0AAV7UA18_PLEWA|nr:hypothetical protein NDU88_002184 [Pleurodeles waltl]